MSTLTLAIPTFNAHSDHLREALVSIASQSRVDQVHVLIVDNASNPAEADFLLTCATEFTSFQFVRHDTNLGYDGNVMRLLDDIDTDFVWFFGDDDILFEGALDAMLSSIAEFPGAKVFLSEAVFFHETSELIDHTQRPAHENSVATGIEFVRRTGYTAAALSTMCVQVDAMKAVDVRFALGTNWIHFAALLAVFAQKPAVDGVLIERDLLAVRRSNATRWFTNFGNQYKSGLALISMIAAGTLSGLGADQYEFYRDRRYRANLIDILTLAWPLSKPERHKLFDESSRHFSGRPRFWLVDGPLLLSPNWIKAFASSSISRAGSVRRLVRAKK